MPAVGTTSIGIRDSMNERHHRWHIRLLIIAILALAAALLPTHIARADGGASNLAYIAGAGVAGGELAIVDISGRKVSGHVTLGGTPWGVVLSPDNRNVYVTLSTKDQLAVIDAQAKTLTTTIPTGPGPTVIATDITKTPKMTLYIANSLADTVTVIDPDAHHPVLATVTVGQHPDGVAVAGQDSGISDPTRSEIYVTCKDSNTVVVLDGNTYAVLATIPVPGGPLGVSVPISGGVAYVTTRDGAIDGIALADHRFLGTILQRDGAQFGAMDYDAITGNVYVPDAATGSVLVLAPATAGGAGTVHIPQEPSRVLPFTGGPTAVAITFDATIGFIAERDTGAVALFDVAARSVVTTITVGGTPHAIVCGSYPPILNRQVAYIAEFVVSGLILFLMGVIGFLIWRRSLKGEQARVSSK